MPTRTPDADPDDRAAPGAAEGELPVPPAIPSLASLRDPRRRTAVDLLVPPAPPAVERPPVAPSAPPARSAQPAAVPAPRPPEWSDLWLLGRHVARSAVAVPVRLAAWQLGCLRRVLGG